MKKVTAFIGSAHKKNTYKAVEQFMNNLQALGDAECEIVRLSDYNLGICRGCQLCFRKGEAFCPLKDDREVLFDKISASDGVIFATPNYTWDLSGMMKIFLDRFGFIVHRPRYFGKAFTSIVAQAAGRGDKIVEYSDFTARTLGFNTLKGVTITAFDTRTEKQQQKIDRDLANLSRRFYSFMAKPARRRRRPIRIPVRSPRLIPHLARPHPARVRHDRCGASPFAFFAKFRVLRAPNSSITSLASAPNLMRFTSKYNLKTSTKPTKVSQTN